MLSRPTLVALLASPRRQGNSAALLAACLKPLRHYAIRYFHLPTLKLHPCQACDHCLKTPTYRCHYADDFSKLITAFDEADALVLSTPVYYYALPAQAKAMVDRCHPLFHDPHWQKHVRRPGIFIANCAAAQKAEFKVVPFEAKAFFNTLGFDYSQELLLPGLGNQDRALRLHRGEARAEKLGARLARQLARKPC